MIISHIRTSDRAIQTNEEHQLGVAERAEMFASSFGCGALGRIMGLLHDKGKEQIAWQHYIMGEMVYDKKSSHLVNRPNHAYVGALMAKKFYPLFSPLISQPIAGHHRGLYDYCDYEEVMKQDIPEEVELDIIPPIDSFTLPRMKPSDLHHLVRMLFSCLVDADSLDTEAFMQPEQAELRGSRATMAVLLRKLECYLENLLKTAADTEVNHIRRYVQEQCVAGSADKAGFYSLTVPTGCGKTLASVLWALNHAVKNNLNRIIIAIPYTSIIVQTAAVLKGIFGEDNVLEHHSNVNPEDVKDKVLRERLQLATENWDYPIIVTTNVQFFESLFSNRRSDCRKIHNIVKSIVILDEVQMLPMQFYKPILNTLDTLQRVFGTSVLFTTASQPILCGRIEGANPIASFDALQSVQEIIPQEACLHEKLRRVELHFLEGAKSYDEVVEELIKHQKVLCIVNTRRDAKELYSRLPDKGIRLHLSRMMCPAHVADTILAVTEALRQEQNLTVRVIATQLIEAGVDIDFPVVFRQEAGLDSVLQAAGRCNREGKQELGNAYVFSLEKEHPLPTGYITQTNNARMGMGKQEDWFAPETMTQYFRQLHARIDNFDEKQMQQLLYKKECEFEKAAHRFRLIDDNAISVIVNWKESMNLYQQLLAQGPGYELMKRLSAYSVNIRKRDFDELNRFGAIQEPFEGIYAITHPGFYRSDTGLTLENQWLEETYII